MKDETTAEDRAAARAAEIAAIMIQEEEFRKTLDRLMAYPGEWTEADEAARRAARLERAAQLSSAVDALARGTAISGYLIKEGEKMENKKLTLAEEARVAAEAARRSAEEARVAAEAARRASLAAASEAAASEAAARKASSAATWEETWAAAARAARVAAEEARAAATELADQAARLEAVAAALEVRQVERAAEGKK